MSRHLETSKAGRDHWLVDAALVSIVAAALVWAHRDGLAAAVRMWSVSPMYSYGYLVPAVSAFLLWTQRDSLLRLEPRPARLLGGGVVLFGTLVLLAGRLGGIEILEHAAFMIATVGLVLVVLGVGHLRIAWASVLYLAMMLPVWDGLTESLHWPFQLRSAEMGVSLMHAIGIPAYREGTMIALPNIALEVARSCSGVNYLVAVVALGLPSSYVYLDGMWRRALLIGGAVMVAALSNGVRVALIGTLAYFDIGSPLHGPFHVLHGLFVAGVGYAALLIGFQLLSRDKTGRDTAGAQPRVDTPRTFRIPRLEAVGLAAVFIASSVVVGNAAPRPSPLTESLEQLPQKLGTWEHVPFARIETPIVDAWVATADHQLKRRYKSADGHSVDVFVGYFASQQQGKEVVNFASLDLHRRSVRHIVTSDERALETNLVRDTRNGTAALFWYEIDRDVATTASGAKLRTLWHALAQRRNNAAVVVVAEVPGSATGTVAGANMDSLVPLLHHALARLLPTGD